MTLLVTVVVGTCFQLAGADHDDGTMPLPLQPQMVATPQQSGHHRPPSSASSEAAAVVPGPQTAANGRAPAQSHFFDDGGNPLDDLFINRNTTTVRQLPRLRLSECLENISAHLESGFTAECSAHGLLCLLWVYTRIKPQVRIADLRDLALHRIE